MRAHGWRLCLLVAVVFSPAAPAGAQLITPYQAAKRFGALRPSGTSPRLGRLAGAHDRLWYHGTPTTTAQLLSLAPFPNVGGGVLPPEQPSASPIRNALEQRNLLKPRSLIAKRVAARAGRLDYLPDENGDWRGAVSPRAERDFRPAPVPPPSVAPTLNDRMADDIKQQAEEYFELGLANYRAGRLNEAADCIALVKEIERDSPRGFIADVFIAQSSQCYFRAIMSLHRAIQNAKSLDDLKIDRFIERMYPGDEVDDQRRAFRREVEVLNLLVNQNPEISQPFILLAYYAWLNGDFGTAVSAAEKAERGSAPDFAQVAARFRKLLQEADRGPPTSSPGG